MDKRQQKQIRRMRQKRQQIREAQQKRRKTRSEQKNENAKTNWQVSGYNAAEGGYQITNQSGDRIVGSDISEYGSYAQGNDVDFSNRGRASAIDRLGVTDARGPGAAGGIPNPGPSGQSPFGGTGTNSNNGDPTGPAPTGSRWRDDGMGGCVLTTQPGDADRSSDKESNYGIDDPPTFGDDYGVDIDWDGGSESINYSPQAGDSAADIATALANAINGNANLGASGFAASANGSSFSFNRGNGLGSYDSSGTGGTNNGDINYGSADACQTDASDGQPGSWDCIDIGSGATCQQVTAGTGRYSTQAECEAALIPGTGQGNADFTGGQCVGVTYTMELSWQSSPFPNIQPTGPWSFIGPVAFIDIQPEGGSQGRPRVVYEQTNNPGVELVAGTGVGFSPGAVPFFLVSQGPLEGSPNDCGDPPSQEDQCPPQDWNNVATANHNNTTTEQWNSYTQPADNP